MSEMKSNDLSKQLVQVTKFKKILTLNILSYHMMSFFHNEQYIDFL